MRITKIKFCNYRPYYNEQIFDIPNNGRIVIVKGENGAGKTNFIKGLTWVLYNEKTLSSRVLFNDAAVNEVAVGSSVKMFIEVHFDHEEKFHILKRELTGKKVSEDVLYCAETYTIEIIFDGKKEKFDDELKISNYINNILNESVKNYFFFDAAKIDNFTKEDHGKDVETAIKNLLKIETIKRAKEHINIVIKETLYSIQGVDQDEIEKTQQAITRVDEDISYYENEIDNLTKEIQAADNDIKKSWDELKHLEDNSKFKEKKVGLEKSLKEKQDIFNKADNDIQNLLSKSYVFFSGRLIDDALAIIKDKSSDEKKIVSQNALIEFIKESIKTNQCYICKDTLSDDKRTYLLQKIPEMAAEKSDTANLLTLNSHLSVGRNDSRASYKSLMISKQHFNELEKTIDDITEQIQDCVKKINQDLPDYSEYETTIKALEKKKYHKEETKQDIKIKFDQLNKEKRNLEEHHLSLTKQNEAFNQEQRKLEICYKIRDEIERIFEQYEKVEIGKINAETKKIFDLIIRKEGFFTDVSIDETYKLNVKKEGTHRNILSDLSYGERQILSLSLIFALAHVSGDHGPFVMDTPLGNLDPIHRRKLLKNATNFIHQMFLLVTGSEFTEDLFEICRDNISVVYRLDDANKGLTKVVKEM